VPILLATNGSLAAIWLGVTEGLALLIPVAAGVAAVVDLPHRAV